MVQGRKEKVQKDQESLKKRTLKALTNERIRLYNGRCEKRTKALTKTVGNSGNFQRTGAGGSPVKVPVFEYHF